MLIRTLLLLLIPFMLSAREVTNGTTALFVFSKIPDKATLNYKSKPVPLLSHPLYAKKKFAFVPINYRETLGDKNLTISYPGGSKALSLHVKRGDYPFETISVAPSKVKPNKKQKERTQREYSEAMKIYRTFTPKRYWHKPFITPMDSKITSPFGTARMFNNTLKSFHSGTDFRAKAGTPVIATNDGVVVLAKNRYYAGNSIIIDHGEGIYSCYYHLSALHVKPGDLIKQGDTIALSGATGRVNGPHLHYAMMIQGIQVDPLQFHHQINSLLH